MKISNSIILIISLFLVGCGADDEKTKVKGEDVSEEKQQTTVLEPHLQTLNQAKAMEKTLQDAEAARKAEMDELEETTEDELN